MDLYQAQQMQQNQDATVSENDNSETQTVFSETESV
jgi:hypothetical protein